MFKSLIDCVAEQLRSVGVTASRETMDRVSDRMIVRGWEDFHHLRSKVVTDLRPFQKPIVRSLGTGALLTEFVTAGVPVDGQNRAVLAALGGLVILIVSTFDVMLDEGGSVPVLFSASPIKPGSAEDARFTLLRELVDLYFRELQMLPNARGEVRVLTETAIHRMYAAEVRSVSESCISRTTWWRKNVLPFVVMGLPAWLGSRSLDAAAFRRHLTWLCRLGEFFGWLDDCVDYADDSATGRPNRIDSQLRRRPAASLARGIAAQAQRVMLQWDAANQSSPKRDVFAVMVWSWIENTHTSPVQ